MSRFAPVSLLLCLVGTGCTPPEPDDVEITLTWDTQDGHDCGIASPDPVSVRVNEYFHFANASDVTYTIVDGTQTAIGSIPYATVRPGESSGSLRFEQPGIVYYYVQSCPPSAIHRNSHVMNVTVAIASPPG
jgi:hypothetical protein